MNPRQPIVIMVGAFPPPMNGNVRVTKAMHRAFLDRDVAVREVNTGVDVSAGHVRFAVLRVARHAAALKHIIKLRRQPATSLYLAGVGGAALLLQLPIILTARAIKMRTYYHHHSWRLATDRSSPLCRWFYRWAGRRTTHIVLCERMRELVQSQGPSSSTTCLGNAAFFGQARTLDRSEHPVRFGHFSNLSSEKGLDTVVNSYLALKREGTDCSLKIGGIPSDPSTHERLNRYLSVDPSIVYVGAIDPENVESFFDDVSLFLFPSTYEHEADPLVVIEAQRSGVPSLTFAAGCLPPATALTSLTDRFGAVTSVHPDDFLAAMRTMAASLASPGVQASWATAVTADYERARHVALGQLDHLIAHLRRGA